MAEENARKAELLSELRGELEKNDYNGNKVDGITVSFRFTCGRVDHTFPMSCSVKVRCADASGALFMQALAVVTGAVSVCHGES